MASEVIFADNPLVVVDTPIVGQTTITFATLSYNLGTGELFIFHNGSSLVIGVDYSELTTTSVIIEFIPDVTGPEVDVFEFHTIAVGSSLFIPPPTVFNQQDPPKRPDNFGGKFVFNP